MPAPRSTSPEDVYLAVTARNDEQRAIVGHRHVLHPVRPLPALQLLACAHTSKGHSWHCSSRTLMPLQLVVCACSEHPLLLHTVAAQES